MSITLYKLDKILNKKQYSKLDIINKSIKSCFSNYLNF